MTLSEAEWEAATPSVDIYTSVYETLMESPGTAYCVDDFFRDAAPSAPDAFELVQRLLDAIEKRASRERSNAIVEMTLERLVYEGHLTKRTISTEEGAVAYFRLKSTTD